MTDDTPALDFEKGGGLIPAIIQDAATGEVLTLFYMDAEALRRTREGKQVWRYSRAEGRRGGELGQHYRILQWLHPQDGDDQGEQEQEDDDHATLRSKGCISLTERRG